MKRLKILQLFSRYLQYGGEEGSIYQIGDALQEHFDVEYFLASSDDLLQGGLVKKLSIPLLTYRNAPVLDKLAAYQKAGSFDCWQIHNVFPAISPGAYALAEKLGIPTIHYLHNYKMGCANGFWFTKGKECRKCMHGNFIHGAVGRCWHDSLAQSSLMGLLLADLRRRDLFNQITRWVAISEAQRALHIEMGLPQDKIDVVHHFLEPDPALLPATYPAEGYGLFIGRLSPEKGVGHLLDAWKLLGGHRRLVIVGDGPDLPALQQKAASLGLANVEFTGFVRKADHPALWDGAAFSIVPSIWQEPFGMVALEAWARGRPVVAHRIGALPEIVTEGVDGFLADPADSEDLARVLERTFSAGADLEEMGQMGLRKLRAYYTKARWVEDMQMVYARAGLLS